jgi:hypothetical protein
VAWFMLRKPAVMHAPFFHNSVVDRCMLHDARGNRDPHLFLNQGSLPIQHLWCVHDPRHLWIFIRGCTVTFMPRGGCVIAGLLWVWLVWLRLRELHESIAKTSPWPESSRRAGIKMHAHDLLGCCHDLQPSPRTNPGSKCHVC